VFIPGNTSVEAGILGLGILDDQTIRLVVNEEKLVTVLGEHFLTVL
jgi:hypothetical protein